MAVDWNFLLSGELKLTLDIIAGLCLGLVIIRTRVIDRVMKSALPFLIRHGIGPTLASAMAVSIGSSKAGAALLAAALKEKRISSHTAEWGTLMLAFPAYLRRWCTTFILSVSLAGRVGGCFAAVLLVRSFLRFCVFTFLLKKGGNRDSEADFTGAPAKAQSLKSFAVSILRTLPGAWFFYALAVLLIPHVETFLHHWLSHNPFFPLPVLAVSGASFAHVSAALALTGGSLASGELTAAQGFFALVFGNSLSMITRLVRTNAGYYFGFFPRKTAQTMLARNIAISTAAAAVTAILAAVPLLLHI